MTNEPFKPDDIIKTCSKLESGLFLHINGLMSCSRGALMSPILYSTDEIRQYSVSKDVIIERRKKLIAMLNDDTSQMDCKQCLLVEQKRYGDIAFSRLDHIDFQNYSLCNLRCEYCSYTRENLHLPPQYDALKVLKLFDEEDVEWNAHVDFAGGEPTLLNNLKEYLTYFRDNRIRVLMYTNGVIFNQSIYDGLADGSIYLVTVSLDAGTQSTYFKLRARDKYLQVLENLSRYASAGSKGNGILVVKYIFCDSNCSEDDIAGFAYAMLAIRPQQIWLTFDFSPIFLGKKDYDYLKLIEAYSKLYLLLKKHGIEAFHYFKEAVASVSTEGKIIMDKLLSTIDKQSLQQDIQNNDLILQDFRTKRELKNTQFDKFTINPLTLKKRDGTSLKWSFEGKRVLLVPSCAQTQKILANSEIQNADWIGLVDRNPIQQGKSINGHMIFSYSEIASLNIDIILVAPPEKHRKEILDSIENYSKTSIQIAEFE